MASQDRSVRQHRGVMPRHFTDEQLFFVLDRVNSHSIKDIMALFNDHFRGIKSLKLSQVKYIRDSYGKDPAWGAKWSMGKAASRGPTPGQAASSPASMHGQRSDTGNGYNSPHLQPQAAIGSSNSLQDDNGYSLQSKARPAGLSLDRNPSGQNDNDNFFLGNNEAPQPEAFNGCAMPALSAVRPEQFSGESIKADRSSPHTRPSIAGGLNYSSSPFQSFRPQMSGNNYRQPPSFGQEQFLGAASGLGNASLSGPPRQAPPTSGNGFSLPGPVPTNTGSNSTAGAVPWTTNHSQVQAPFNLEDFQPNWPAAPLDFNGMDLAAANPPASEPLSYTLFGPGTWHQGTHDNCLLDAQHRHCPDGGVYFSTAAGAEQMLIRVRQSVPVPDVTELTQEIRELREYIRDVETRYRERATVGVMQGSGQMVMLMDIGHDPFAPGDGVEGAWSEHGQAGQAGGDGDLGEGQ